MKTEFREEQKFNQWWFWLLMLGLLFLPFYTFFFKGFFAGLSVVPIFFVMLLFFLIKLRTEITNEKIYMTFFPFVYKTIQWNEVESLNVLDYGFAGGWGIRFWTSYGTVYNIRGSKGVLIKLKSGKKFVIGTQKEEELIDVLDSLGKISEQ